MQALLRDLRHGLRVLLAHPGFTATAVLSLALGIGANSALFGMFNSLLWKPLPVEAPDELVVLYSRRDVQSFYQPFSYPEYRDYGAETGVFAGVVGYTPAELSLRTDGRDDARAVGELVTGTCWVGRRTRELGVRVAVGARPADVFRLVMGQGLALAGIGLALGLAGAFAASRVVANLLFGVSATDPFVFAGVPLLLATVAALATFVPARRALKIDPLVALRSE